LASLIDEAKAYQPPKTKNVADLEIVPVSLEVEERSGTDKDDRPFSYKVVIVNGEEYRVPNIVLKQLQAIAIESPTVKNVKVLKSGEGLNTSYNVIPLSA